MDIKKKKNNDYTYAITLLYVTIYILNMVSKTALVEYCKGENENKNNDIC
jgi:hypothetical protein